MNVTRSTHPRRLAALAAATTALSLSALAGSAIAAPVTPGPAGDAFYSDTAPAGFSTHGDLIRYRPSSAATTLPDAARSYTVLYRSKSLKNRSIQVSGSVYIPKGTPPAGGWNVISWAHGTTGAADICAPSRDDGGSDAHGYIAYATPSIGYWLQQGFAVVATDYEGLGTPGEHPYLIGHSEGRGVLDIVRAARKLPGESISNQFVISGHSQGGHAALYAASDAKSWTPDLSLKGVAAFAPANSLDQAVLTAKFLITTPNGISGLGALIVRSISYANTALKLSKLMPAGPLALMPQIETKCSPGLAKSDSFGQFKPADLLKSWSKKNSTYQAAINALKGPAMSPNGLKFKAPILILQGGMDGTVLPNLTTKLADTYTKANRSITVQFCLYEKDKTNPCTGGSPFSGSSPDHGGIVATGTAESGYSPSPAWVYTTDWIKARFG